MLSQMVTSCFSMKFPHIFLEKCKTVILKFRLKIQECRTLEQMLIESYIQLFLRDLWTCIHAYYYNYLHVFKFFTILKHVEPSRVVDHGNDLKDKRLSRVRNFLK